MKIYLNNKICFIFSIKCNITTNKKNDILLHLTQDVSNFFQFQVLSLYLYLKRVGNTILLNYLILLYNSQEQ